MVKITLDVPDELAEQLVQVGDRLVELVTLSLQQPALPAHTYRYVLDFLATNPSPEELAAFKPTSQMQQRLGTLLARSKAGELTPAEARELDDYEHIEHLIVLLKAGALRFFDGER
ncbi:MAG: hypothetical protein H7Y22_18660 [Gemmatimonadaceae bacterium]|nr:hypothetical protein [Gloeobacterales cyanobacterium ES-bin-141]